MAIACTSLDKLFAEYELFMRAYISAFSAQVYIHLEPACPAQHHFPLQMVSRAKTRCLSCRALKIKCDEGTPKCEYCVHTHRECVYPTGRKPRARKTPAKEPSAEPSYKLIVLYSDLDSLLLSSASSASPNLLFYAQISLNSPPSQLRVTKFEFRLLHYFSEFFYNVISSQAGNVGQEYIWKCQVPKLCQQSPLVRSNIYALSTMHLWSLCDLLAVMPEELATDSSYSPTASTYIILDEITVDNNLLVTKSYLYDKAQDYFVSTLRNTFVVMKKFMGLDMKVTSGDEAAEIVISGILLFLFLVSQPYRLIQMVSFEEGEADLLSICRGMAVSMGKSFPVLFRLSFSGLFNNDESLTPPLLADAKRFLVINYLRKKLDYFVERGVVDPSDMEVYDEAINSLELLLHRVVHFGFSVPLLKWIFLLHDKFFKFVKTDRNPFALKLVYVYSAISTISNEGLNTPRGRMAPSVFRDFVRWYHHYTRKHGSWDLTDPFDEDLYRTVCVQQFGLRHEELFLLESFMPGERRHEEWVHGESEEFGLG